MNPIVDRWFAIGTCSLGDFALVMRKFEVDAAAVDIKCIAEILCAHHRTFDMPPRKSVAPRRGPAHDVRGRRFFPQGEIDLFSFLVLAIQFPSTLHELVNLSAGEN